MESDETKISVWVCREEKLVSGLSKRTTCAHVIHALVEELSSRRGASAAPRSYCVVEKWRGFERVLPNETKLLRLWVAWGEERRNVRFVLVRCEASMANRGARCAEARVVLSKRGPCVTEGPARAPVGGISPEKQRRIVRKAFRKLERINKKKKKRDASCAERMETLAHLVISQDHTIRQQIQRISELDAEIERCEAEVHMARIKRHGVNYVQDTYLVDAAAADGDELCAPENLAKFEEYVLQCEDVLRLHEELLEQEALVDAIGAQVQEELNLRWMRRRTEELRAGEDLRAGEGAAQPDAQPDAPSENELLLLEAERIRTQLDASSYIGLRLSTDLEAIRSDLELTREICGAREKEMRDLLERVDSLDIEEGTAGEQRCGHGPHDDDHTGRMSALERKSEWVEQARGLSKAHTGTDDDSDTGLSSLHSQDSDSQPVWESLV